MDAVEIGKKARALADRNAQAMANLVAFGRTMEPLLRDLNHNNSADRLSAILGEFDAVEAESREFLRSSAPDIMLMMFGGNK